MIDEFWRYYQQYYFAYFYHDYERAYLLRCLRLVSILTYLVTAIALAWWSVVQRYAAVWSVIIFASQVANNLKDQFNVGKRAWMLEAYLENLARDLEGMSECWRTILMGNLTEGEIHGKMTFWASHYTGYEDKYIRPCSQRNYKRFEKKANTRANAELEIKHGKGVEDV